MDHAAVVYLPRICGSTHLEGCHHAPVMREGVAAFLASPTTRDTLASVLAALSYPSLSPEGDADLVLASLRDAV